MRETHVINMDNGKNSKFAGTDLFMKDGAKIDISLVITAFTYCLSSGFVTVVERWARQRTDSADPSAALLTFIPAPTHRS